MRFTAFILLLLISAPNPIGAQSSVSNLEVMYTEQRLDALATAALTPFLDLGTYRVSVRVLVDSLRVATSATTDSGTAAGSERLPALPFYQRGTESEIRRPAGQALTPEPASDQIVLRSMTVTLWLSDQLRPEDVDFATRVVREALKLDIDRGDRISVRRESMPIRQTERIGASVAAVTRDSLSTASLNLTQKNTTEWWLVLLGLGGLLLVGYAAWRFRTRKTSVVTPEPMVDELEFRSRSVGTPLVPQPVAAIASSTPVLANGVAPRFDVGRVTISHLDDRIDSMEFLLHVFMIHTEEMARMMESWVVRDSVAGIERVVSVLSLVDPKFLDAFKPFMSRMVMEQVERSMIGKWETGSTRSGIELLQTTARDVKKRFRVEDGTVRLIALPHFDFVNHIDDRVLSQLLADGSPETSAMVLYHLESRRASVILSYMPAELAEQSLLLIPLVRGFEFPVYERIAKEVFDKYHEWLRAQSLVTKGLVITGKILENLDDGQRIRHLDSMMEVDPVWTANVRQEIIAVETLDSIPDTLLRPVVMELNLDRLAVLCAVAPEVLAERMASLRTERERVRLNQLRVDAADIPEQVRHRELAELVTLLRRQRAEIQDQSLIR